MVRIACTAIVVALLLSGSLERHAGASSLDGIEILTMYAVVLGRATACGLNTAGLATAASKWLDQTYKGADREKYMATMLYLTAQQAAEQSEGKSPDTCADVARNMAEMGW
jgi:hypothetical protein